METKKKRAVIVGGGFAGVKCALELQKKNIKHLKITLISERKNFEYHGALYRTVTGGSPLEVCLPLRTILDPRKVELVYDKAASVDVEAKTVTGRSGSVYHYDDLVLGLGSETNFFGVPGLQDHSYGMKTINDALILKKQIDRSVLGCLSEEKEKQLCSGNFVVVGGGATGVELAAELSVYARKKAREYDVDPSLISVNLIEAMPRLLPTLPLAFSKRMETRLRSLGVNIFLNRAIQKEDLHGVALRDMNLKTDTVVWTAGVRANGVHDTLKGVQQDKRGRVLVDEYMQAKGVSHVYVLGDGAVTEYSGMAQTALLEGVYVAERLATLQRGKKHTKKVKHKKPIYAIPAGPGWSGTIIGSITLYGTFGWVGRRLVDMVVFTSFLPFRKALVLFRAR